MVRRSNGKASVFGATVSSTGRATDDNRRAQGGVVDSP
jgi:hypothetical protein